MLVVDNLSLSLGGKPVLSNISFSLLDGENLVVLGKSGSGKTVLIKTLMGLYVPDEGSIVIDNIDILNDRKSEIENIKKSISMVFQNAALLDSFSVFQNVALPLYERGLKDKEQLYERVLQCLEIVGLKHTLDKVPAELSGGMRKRIGIARALVYSPSYIVFDEPISGLDPITSKEVLYYIRQIIEKSSASVITITHDTRDLRNIADRALFIDNGKILFFGSVEDLYSSQDSTIMEFLE